MTTLTDSMPELSAAVVLPNLSALKEFFSTHSSRTGSDMHIAATTTTTTTTTAMKVTITTSNNADDGKQQQKYSAYPKPTDLLYHLKE